MTAVSELLHGPLVGQLGWTLLHFLWQGAAIVVVAELMLVLLRRGTPAARYVSLVAAFAVLTLCPPATFAWLGAARFSTATDRLTAVASTADDRPLNDVDSRHATPSPSGNGAIRATADGRSGRAAEEPAPAEAAAVASRAPAVPEPRFLSLEPLLPWLVMAWMAGVAGLSVRMLVGWFGVQRLRSARSEPAPDEWMRSLERLRGGLGIRRAVRLVRSTVVRMPSTIGWIQPVILFPASILTGLSLSQIEAILAHELAHIRRHDYLVNLLQAVVETLLFYHPAVWRLSQRIRVEREHCCDDLACELLGNRVAYAGALVRLAEIDARAPRLAVAANEGDLLPRVRRLLGLAPPSPRISPWIGAALLVLMSSGLAAGLQGMHSASAVTVDRLPSAGIIGQEPLPETSVILPAGPSDATFPDPASTTSAFPEPPVDIDPARSTPLAAADNAAPVVFKNGVWLYIADADGSNMKLLTDLPDYPYQGSPSWSQDGKLIAFDVQKPQNGEQDKDARIVVVNADGTNPRVFGDGAMPSFSPGGKRLAISRYSPNPGVWVMSAEKPGEEPVLLDDRGWGTDWSPDGRSILYTVTTGNGANFVVFDLVEGERRLVFPEDNLPYRTLFWNFSWSPDSKRIAFRGEKADGKSETGIVDARGSKHGLTTRLTDSTWNWVAWSPDGARILTTRNEPGRKFPQIFSFKPDGNEPLEWLRGQTDEAANVSAAWSPDGKKLALCSRQQPPLRKPFPDQGAR